MAITTPLMDEILQHFARVFPMPGRIDGREDYLALVKTWSDQLEPYTDEQVKEACRRLMGKLKRFPYPSDVRDELAPASATSTTVGSLSVKVDTSSIDAALAKVDRLKAATTDEKISDALCALASSGASQSQLLATATGLSAAIKALTPDLSAPASASRIDP